MIELYGGSLWFLVHHSGRLSHDELESQSHGHTSFGPARPAGVVSHTCMKPSGDVALSSSSCPSLGLTNGIDASVRSSVDENALLIMQEKRDAMN